MITKYLQGDLVTMIQNSLDNKHGNIRVAHGCNCCRTMGSGIAGQFKQYFPEVYDADMRFGCPQLGMHSVAPIQTQCTYPETAVIVYNMYTQQRYGKGSRHVNYAAVAECFASINGEEDVMYIPRIGAGLGGGDWNIIEQIINDATPDTEIIVIDFKKDIDPRDSQI